MVDYYLAWWNLENLFDLATSSQRPAWLRSRLAGELQGWTAAVLNRKVARLASVIEQMNGGLGPDLLGVCEVENDAVLQRLVNAINLPGRDYRVEHHDMSDKRGIDVAFIYDANWLTADMQFSHVVQKRSPTRDLFQVNFTTTGGTQFIVIGNHWPSRMGGTYESEPYRIIAAETLAYFHERIREIRGPDVPVIVMGDMNDGPESRSMTDYALSTNSRQKVLNSRSAPRLYNCMWPILGQGQGTHYFDNFPACLDQILVSRSALVGTSVFRARVDTIEVVKLPGMFSGGYEAPKRFGRPSSASTFDRDGFSDHFPIGMVLEA